MKAHEEYSPFATLKNNKKGESTMKTYDDEHEARSLEIMPDVYEGIIHSWPQPVQNT